MPLPKSLSKYFAQVPLSTVLLTGGIFVLVFGISAGATTFILESKIDKEHAAKAEKQILTQNHFVAPPIEAQAAIIYDLKTKQVLFEKNATERLPLASLTKLITLLTATNVLAPNDPVILTSDALKQYGDYGFSAGETFAFRDIARLALVASSNDAAEAIADSTAAKERIAETTHATGLMAGTLSSLGLSQTSATNPTGLDQSTTVAGAYGTAADVAHIAASVLERAPDIASATTEPQVTARSLEGTSHTLANTNPTVSSLPGVLLSKTGYTDLAGGNLVMIFDIGINHPVAIVVLGSSVDGRFADVTHLRESLLSSYLPS